MTAPHREVEPDDTGGLLLGAQGAPAPFHAPAAAPSGGSAADVVVPPATEPGLPERVLSRPPLRAVPRTGSPWRWVLALTVVGFAVRVALVDVQSMWLDETLSVGQAGLPLGDLWEFQLTGNVHVPGYHTLLHFWMLAFGTGEVAVRMLSVVLGTPAIPLTFLLGRRLLGERTGVVAGGIAAVAPFWVWHADEARMYPLMLTVGLAGMVLLLRALDDGGWLRWSAYAVAIAAACYSHYFLFLMPPVHLAVVLLSRPGWRRFLAWSAAMAAGLATFVPWAVLFVENRIVEQGSDFTNHLQGTQDNGFFAALYAVVIFVAVYLVGYHSADVLAVVSGVLVGLWPAAALTLTTRRRHLTGSQVRAVAFLFGWLTWIVGIGWVIDHVSPGAWYQKYLTMGSVPVVLLVAFTLAVTPWRLSRVVPAAMAVLMVATVGMNLEPKNLVRQDWRGAVAHIKAERQPGDLVVVTPTLNLSAFMYYYKPESLGPGPEGSVSGGRGGVPRVPSEVFPMLSNTNSSNEATSILLPRMVNRYAGQRIWYLRSLDEAYDSDGALPAWLTANTRLVEHRHYVADTDLYLFVLPVSPAFRPGYGQPKWPGLLYPTTVAPTVPPVLSAPRTSVDRP